MKGKLGIHNTPEAALNPSRKIRHSQKKKKTPTFGHYLQRGNSQKLGKGAGNGSIPKKKTKHGAREEAWLPFPKKPRIWEWQRRENPGSSVDFSSVFSLFSFQGVQATLWEFPAQRSHFQGFTEKDPRKKK